jgi:hypothetical protein
MARVPSPEHLEEDRAPCLIGADDSLSASVPEPCIGSCSMTHQVGSELAGIDQHCAQLALEALHQFLGPLLEFAITAAAITKIADRDAADELATWIELGDEGVDLARLEGESGYYKDLR